MPRIFLGSEIEPSELSPTLEEALDQTPHRHLSLWQWLVLWFEMLLESQHNRPPDDYHPPIPSSYLWSKF